MRRYKNIVMLFLALCIMVLTACNKKVSHPAGVIGEGDEQYYIIQLPLDSSVDDYFSRIGPETSKSVWETKNDSRTVIYISEVNEGGWIVYKDNLVAYVPFECGENVAKGANVTISISRGTDNFMSLDSAKEYLPFLEN